MAQKITMTKRLMIIKSQQLIVIVMSVCAFVTVFSLVSAKSLLSQSSYQNRVISAQNKAVTQLKSDITAVQQLNGAYQTFNSLSPNVIGGNPNGNGPNDGANADIVLDALPSTYNFPALATSLAKILSTEGVTVNVISGTDEEATESTTTSSATPVPVTMPFSISVSGAYANVQNVVNEFQASIRPFQILNIDLSGDSNEMTMTLGAQTYFQPGKSFETTTETVK